MTIRENQVNLRLESLLNGIKHKIKCLLLEDLIGIIKFLTTVEIWKLGMPLQSCTYPEMSVSTTEKRLMQESCFFHMSK